MSSLLELIASSNESFQDTTSVLFGEAENMEDARVFRTRGKGGLLRRDHFKGYPKGVIRRRPNHVGYAIHSKAYHNANHGIGSFCRTHHHPTCNAW